MLLIYFSVSYITLSLVYFRVEKLGYDVPEFDFRVSGVTSISADIHKYGYGTKVNVRRFTP